MLGLDKELIPVTRFSLVAFVGESNRCWTPGFRSVIEQTITGVQFVHREVDPLVIYTVRSPSPAW